MQSKVSMVVPCYNKAPYIGEMLQSVYDQLWNNIEVVLVNDGSTDGTREIIAEWEPRLRARGYEVVIIDQENQGVAAAVRNGLLRMTGEYVCMPDCDDRLHPEYVSAMAGWLDAHPQDEWVVCDMDICPLDFESAAGLKRELLAQSGYYSYRLFESYITRRVRGSVCASLLRSDFVRRSIDSPGFIADMRYTQEPQINYRLAARAKAIVNIPRVLYCYTKSDSRHATMRWHREMSFQLAKEYSTMRGKIALRTLENDGCPLWTLRVAEVSEIYADIKFIRKYREAAAHIKKRTAEFTEKLFAYGLLHPSALGGRDITPENIETFFRAFSNAIIGHKPKTLDICGKPNGRIIAYAVLSRAAKALLPCVIGTSLRPDLLWDAAAKADSVFRGVKVTPPDFSGLTEDDTVLVFLKDAHIAGTVSALLESTKSAGNIYYYYDVLDCLAGLLFPQVTSATVNRL